MPTNIADKVTGGADVSGILTAAEFNIVKNLVDSNEALAGAAAAAAAAASSSATTNATAIAANATAISAAAAAAAAAQATANSAVPSANLAALISGNSVVAANTAKVGVPNTSGTPGFLYNSAASGSSLSYIAGINEWLDATDDAALITAIGSATFTNNVATISGWAASRKHIDGSYLYEANVADTVTRIALGSGTDAVSLQGRNVATTAPTDGQAMVWNNASSQWEPGTVSGGGGSTFDESVFRVFNNANNTKQMRMELGAISAGETRQLIFPDADVNLANVRTAAQLISTINSELSGTGWQSGGSGSTNLGWNAGTRTISSSSGVDAVISLATTNDAGLMSAADKTTIGNVVNFNGTGLVVGDMAVWNGSEYERDTATTGDAQTTFTLGYAGSLYTGCTASSYTINGTGLASRKSAIALITSASEPTFTLSGGTVTKVGWGSNWDDTNQNHVTFVAASSNLVYAYLSGAEA